MLRGREGFIVCSPAQQGKKDLPSKHVREVLVHPDSKLTDWGWFLRWEPRPAPTPSAGTTGVSGDQRHPSRGQVACTLMPL